MNKLVFIFIFLIIVVLYIFNKDRLFWDNFTVMNNIKAKYVEYMLDIEEFFDKYFQQTKVIEKLTKENEDLVKYQSLYLSKKLENESIIKANQSFNFVEENIKLAKVLSYVNFNDFTSIWLDSKKKNNNIEGLIDGEYSAGIVINNSGYAQALLNGNEKANYAVFVGKNKAPGITHQNKDSEFLTIKYIPIWIDINIGDEVVTSGMDNIFFEGLKVGKVLSIRKMADLQEATIKPYSQVLKKRYFHIYSKKENTSKSPQNTPLVENQMDNKTESSTTTQ